MSTHFVGEGNIGSAPDYREFPNGNDEPRRLLRLNVYFDNPIPRRTVNSRTAAASGRRWSCGTATPTTGKTCTRRACACW
jgi:single-stranded DNA-binding protein